MRKTVEGDQKLVGKWGTSEARFYYDTEGEIVTIDLRSGGTVRGCIVGLDNYAIVLQRESDKRRILIHKHAVDLITPD